MIDSRGCLRWVANWYLCAWYCRIIELSNDLDKGMKEALRQCAYQLKKLGEVNIWEEIQTKSSDTHTQWFYMYTIPQYNYASDIYEKVEDYEALAALYVETQQWEQVGTVNMIPYNAKLGEVFNLVNWWIHEKLLNLKPTNI